MIRIKLEFEKQKNAIFSIIFRIKTKLQNMKRNTCKNFIQILLQFKYLNNTIDNRNQSRNLISFPFTINIDLQVVEIFQ